MNIMSVRRRRILHAVVSVGAGYHVVVKRLNYFFLKKLSGYENIDRNICSHSRKIVGLEDTK